MFPQRRALGGQGGAGVVDKGGRAVCAVVLCCGTVTSVVVWCTVVWCVVVTGRVMTLVQSALSDTGGNYCFWFNNHFRNNANSSRPNAGLGIAQGVDRATPSALEARTRVYIKWELMKCLSSYQMHTIVLACAAEDVGPSTHEKNYSLKKLWKSIDFPNCICSFFYNWDIQDKIIIRNIL